MGYPHGRNMSLVKASLGKGNSPRGTQLRAFRSQHQAAERKWASFVKRDWWNSTTSTPTVDWKFPSHCLVGKSKVRKPEWLSQVVDENPPSILGLVRDGWSHKHGQADPGPWSNCRCLIGAISIKQKTRLLLWKS